MYTDTVYHRKISRKKRGFTHNSKIASRILLIDVVSAISSYLMGENSGTKERMPETRKNKKNHLSARTGG